MSKRISMEDIARQVRVSRATVSYVINGRTDEAVGEETRRRILSVAEELGYRPNRAAQALAGQRSFQIEFFVRQVHPAFYSHSIQEFQKQLARSRYELRVVPTHLWTEADWSGAGSSWPIDGIVTFDDVMAPGVLRQLRERQIPVVSAGGTVSEEIDHVIVDLREAALEAVRWLIRSGRRRIAHMNIADYASSGRGRAYLDAMAEACLPAEIIAVDQLHSPMQRESYRASVREHVKYEGCPDAVLCYNDEMAVAALAGFRDMGRSSPEDIAIIGCDGIEEMNYHEPALSTIQFPYAEVARKSWEFLRRRIESPSISLQSAILKPQLILRRSSQIENSRSQAGYAARAKIGSL